MPPILLLTGSPWGDPVAAGFVAYYVPLASSETSEVSLTPNDITTSAPLAEE
jgi:hypothetical protein